MACFKEYISFWLDDSKPLIINTLCKKELQLSNEDFFSKCNQIHNFLRIWSHLLKKSLMENFIFCAVLHPVSIC